MNGRETDPKRFNLDLHCPNCGHLVRGLPESNPVYDISPHSDQIAYLIVRCPRNLCGVFFVTYDRLNNWVRQVFPFPNTSEASFHKSIPENIRTDFAEARRCLFSNAHKGVVVMCRRVMQHIALDKGAGGSRLVDQIDDLRAKGLITVSLQQAAHEIRHFGNFGAHPRDDGLDDIEEAEAKAILSLINEFLVDLYVRPHDTAQLTAKRKNP